MAPSYEYISEIFDLAQDNPIIDISFIDQSLKNFYETKTLGIELKIVNVDIFCPIKFKAL